jgi:hypothetical protein
MLMPCEATAHSCGQPAGDRSAWAAAPSRPNPPVPFAWSGVGVGGRLATTVAESSAVIVANGRSSTASVGTTIGGGSVALGSGARVGRGVRVGALVGAAVGASPLAGIPHAASVNSKPVIRSRLRCFMGVSASSSMRVDR